MKLYKRFNLTRKKKVLFICTHNSARSQMAEGLLRNLYGSKYEVYSAGTNPTKINPFAVKVMKEKGIDISNQYAKNLSEFKNANFDYVVTVCDNAKETCPYFPGEIVLHRNFEDPSKYNGKEEEKYRLFRKIRDEIENWIKNKFASLN